MLTAGDISTLQKAIDLLSPGDVLELHLDPQNDDPSTGEFTSLRLDLSSAKPTKLVLFGKSERGS